MKEERAGISTDGGAPDQGAASFTMRVASSIAEIDRESWNACASRRESGRRRYNPFIAWDFLRCLEESGSACAETGWLPQHLVLERDDAVCAVAPCYLKSHSYGEYVFDHGWADAFEAAGGHYYPKLQVSVPFTPVSGPRFMVGDGLEVEVGRTMLASGLAELCLRRDASSAHVTFMEKDEWRQLASHGFLQRKDQQFHWLNDNYRSFDDFLAALASRKRKAIRRERREAADNDLSIERLTGSDIATRHWDALYRFYKDTGSRKWGRPYLNRRFFDLLGERMAGDVLLVLAQHNGRYVAGALNLIGSEALYGRYWGCIETHPFLHFEICYHQAIEFAIERGLDRVEAGAQGAHKLARGYVPVPTYSSHFIPDPGFRRALASYLERECEAVDQEIALMAEHSPFRADG